jgi:DNA-binding MarR family transcriptional regulator
MYSASSFVYQGSIMTDTASIEETDVGNHADYLINQVIRLQRAIHRLKNTNTDSARSAHAILLLISMHGPLRVADLAVKMCVDASTVSRQTAWLVNDGLLQRTSDPADGRASVLALTERGKSVASEVAERRRELFTRVIHDWSGRDLQTFGSLLRRFVDGLDAQPPLGGAPLSSSTGSGETT